MNLFRSLQTCSNITFSTETVFYYILLDVGSERIEEGMELAFPEEECQLEMFSDWKCFPGTIRSRSTAQWSLQKGSS